MNFPKDVIERDYEYTRNASLSDRSSKLQLRQATPYVGTKGTSIEEESRSGQRSNPQAAKSRGGLDSIPKLCFPNFANSTLIEGEFTDTQQELLSSQYEQTICSRIIEESSNQTSSFGMTSAAESTKKPIKSALKKKSLNEADRIPLEGRNTLPKKLRITDDPPEVIDGPKTQHSLSHYADHVTSIVDFGQKQLPKPSVEYSKLS